MQFELHTGTAEGIKDKLDKGLLDVGILMEPVEVEKYEFDRLPQKEIWGILMPEDDPLAQKTEITPADLRSLPLIVSWRIGEREAKAWFGGDTGRLNIFCTYDMADNAAPVGGTPAWICFCNPRSAKTHSGACFPPTLSRSQQYVGDGLEEISAIEPAVQKFLELVRNAYRV